MPISNRQLNHKNHFNAHNGIEDTTLEKLEILAKKGDNIARKMKKLVQEGAKRLKDQNKAPSRRG